MKQTKTSDNMALILVGTVVTAVVAIAALLSLGIFINYITLPRSPTPMDLPEAVLFYMICCPGAFVALTVLALFLGVVTIKSYKARRANIVDSVQQAGERQADSPRASNRSDP